MNILITGIHGFVGTNLVESLKSNHNIYGLDIIRPERDGVLKTYNWNELDSLPPIDVVIHLAGKAHDTKNQTESQVYFDINTGLTLKIYDWFRESLASKFIFFSSVKAAADSVEGVLTEEIVPIPLGPYGESKMAAENYILSLQSAVCSTKNNESKTIDSKLQTKNFFILRPCMIHGPGNKGNLNLLYSVVKKGIPYPLGAFENKRSFCSIDNLCFVINSLISKNIESGIYNVCDDQTLSTNELIEIMSETLGKKSRVLAINKPIIEFCAKLGTLLHLPLNSERLRKLTENYIVSNAKIKAVMEIESMPVSSKEGLSKTLNSFLKD